jgi:hypothetical protein
VRKSLDPGIRAQLLDLQLNTRLIIWNVRIVEYLAHVKNGFTRDRSVEFDSRFVVGHGRSSEPQVLVDLFRIDRTVTVSAQLKVAS